MSGEWDDARLAEAFRSLVDADIDVEVDAEQVWRAVSGQLSPEERRAVIDKVATEPGWAEAWRIANELWRASAGPDSGNVVALSDPRAPRRSRIPAWAAVAAAAVVAMVGFYLIGARSPSPPIYRGAVESLVANDTSLARDDFRLDWSAPEGARFEVRVTAEDLRVLDRVSGLEASDYVVPADRLSDVPSGARIFWQVQATLPDGSVVESETFIVQLR